MSPQRTNKQIFYNLDEDLKNHEITELISQIENPEKITSIKLGCAELNFEEFLEEALTSFPNLEEIYVSEARQKYEKAFELLSQFPKLSKVHIMFSSMFSQENMDDLNHIKNMNNLTGIVILPPSRYKNLSEKAVRYARNNNFAISFIKGISKKTNKEPKDITIEDLDDAIKSQNLKYAFLAKDDRLKLILKKTGFTLEDVKDRVNDAIIPIKKKKKRREIPSPKIR